MLGHAVRSWGPVAIGWRDGWPDSSGKEAFMNRLFAMIFIMAFTSITGMIIVALLTMNMSEPAHFYGAVVAGAVIAAIASMIISKKIRA
jgi:hypothetical protein